MIRQREAFLEVAKAHRPEDPVSVPPGLLIAFLEGTGTTEDAHACSLPPADLTVAHLATRFGRSRGTCRAWVEAGRFPGSYRLHGTREWRIPAAALAAFETTERERVSPTIGKPAVPQHRRGGQVNLSAWRQVG
jgi:hypothetical protein